MAKGDIYEIELFYEDVQDIFFKLESEKISKGLARATLVRMAYHFVKEWKENDAQIKAMIEQLDATNNKEKS